MMDTWSVVKLPCSNNSPLSWFIPSLIFALLCLSVTMCFLRVFRLEEEGESSSSSSDTSEAESLEEVLEIESGSLV